MRSKFLDFYRYYCFVTLPFLPSRRRAGTKSVFLELLLLLLAHTGTPLFHKNMITNQMTFLFIEFDFSPKKQRKSNCENHSLLVRRGSKQAFFFLLALSKQRRASSSKQYWAVSPSACRLPGDLLKSRGRNYSRCSKVLLGTNHNFQL